MGIKDLVLNTLIRLHTVSVRCQRKRKQDMAANGVLLNSVHRICHGVLYFKIVISVYGTRINVMSFESIMKVRLSFRRFSQSSRLSGLYVRISHTEFHRSKKINVERTNENWFTALHKVWLLLRRFLWSSHTIICYWHLLYRILPKRVEKCRWRYQT